MSSCCKLHEHEHELTKHMHLSSSSRSLEKMRKHSEAVALNGTVCLQLMDTPFVADCILLYEHKR